MLSFLLWLGLATSKWHSWKHRYGKANEHNAWIPRDHWLTDAEKQAIRDFHALFYGTTPTDVELASLLEGAILALPLKYRAVLMMRDIEEMSVEETACFLGISKVNVKVRLHRARALMRRELYFRARATSSAAFKFLGARCDRIVKGVLERLTRVEERSASEIRR